MPDAEHALGPGAPDHGAAPAPQGGEAVAEPVEEGQVHEHPDDEPGEAAETQGAHADDRLEAADGRSAAEVPVLEGDAFAALQSPLDRVGGMQAALHGHLADAGQVVDGGHVADGEDLGVPGQGEIGQDGDPAGAVGLRSGGLGQQAGQRRGLDPGRPDDGAAFEAALLAVGVFGVDAERIDTDDAQAHLQLDAHLLERRNGRGPRAGRRSWPAAPGHRRPT